MASLKGREHLSAAMSRKRGAIILSAHVGNWEVLSALLAQAGVPLTVVARRPDDPVLADRLSTLRGRWGVRTIWRDRGARPILRALANGRAVAMLIDQATDVAGEYVPFFDQPAHTPTGPAKIALRTGAPIVPVHMTDGPASSYVGVVDPPVTVDETETPEAAMRLTAELTTLIESWVREAPHTWVWMHDRWRAMKRVPNKTRELEVAI